ncbi:MAG TPA: alpha/beta hydrolase [Candidatus Saccharimonadales bacterium]|nr:alpha/beta hydrolase [Candidatus Saccharimonadales bacterium]
MTIVAMIAVPLSLGALAAIQALLARRDRLRFPPPGRIVEGLHVRALGAGTPAIVFESGIAASCLSWNVIQTQLAAVGATYSYDRSGYGWSAAGNGGCSLEKITRDLHGLLDALHVPRPFLFIGHSFGGFIARYYVHRYPEEVAGLVLVDPVTPEEWQSPSLAQRRRLRRAIFFTRAAGVLACFGMVRLGLWVLLRRGNGNPGPLLGLSDTMRRVAAEVGKLARPADSARLAVEGSLGTSATTGAPAPAVFDVVSRLRARWSVPGFFWTMASYISALPTCAAQVASCALPAHLPLTVLSGAHQPPERLAEHAAISTRHLIAGASAHWIHLDQPDLVIEAIHEVAGRVAGLT